MNYKILTIVTFLLATIPVVIFAQTPPVFVPLVGIPGISDPNSTNVGAYINALYTLSISIAALLAVIKIIIAGVKYVLSDVVTSKAEAKSDIQGALVGLLIVISAVVVLETINPQLRVMRLFVSAASQPANRQVTPAPTGAGQAPLPGPVASDNTTVAPCASPEACRVAATTCLNSAQNARVTQEPTSSGTRVTCTYGTTTRLNCPVIGGAPSCRGTVTACTRIGGTWTQVSAGTGQCFRPHDDRPYVEDRGTRGGA